MFVLKLISTKQGVEMELFQEILCHVLSNEKVQVSFPQLENTDVSKIVELECYQAFRRIKTILEDDSLDNREYFHRIEEILSAFEELASSCDGRHDLG